MAVGEQASSPIRTASVLAERAIEKMFGTMEMQYFRNLAGNTHILKTAPKITSQDNP